MSNEFAYAVALANRILEQPHGDPDDDLAVLSRQFLRACERARDIPPPAGVPTQPVSHSDPHPTWKAGVSARHPATLEEWDSRNDSAGSAFVRSLHRLCVAGDYADPRAPDEMALVLRIDLIRLIGDWQHKNAAWECWRTEPGRGREALETIKNRIYSRLNDYLAEMKPNFDDSICGFNEAWDIMRKVFDEANTPVTIDPHNEVGPDLISAEN